MNGRHRWLTTAAVVLLLLIPFLLKMWLWIPFDGGVRHFGGDFVRLMYPWLESSVAAWHDGGPPLYTPLEGLGRPLHTNLQAAVFYPGTMVLSALFPLGAGFHVAEFYLLLHLSIAALGAYVLARTLGLSSWPATFAGCAFAASGFFLNHVTILSMTASAVWTPWVLAAAIRAFRPGGWRWIPAAAAATACSVLGGLPQPAYYAILFISLAAVWFSARRRSVVPLVSWTAIGVLAFSLSAPALLPGAADLPLLLRGGDWRWEMNAPSQLAPRALSIIAPQASDSAGLPAAYSFYAGAAVLVLAVAGAFAGRLREKSLLIAGLVFFLFFGMAAELGLDDGMAAAFPGYRFFKEHERAGVMIVLVLALLAASALERWRQDRGGLIPRIVIFAGGAVALANVAALLLTPALREVRAYLSQSVLFAAAALAVVLAGLSAARRPRFALALAVAACAAEFLAMGNTNNLREEPMMQLERQRRLLTAIPEAPGAEPPRVLQRAFRNLATLNAAFGVNTLYTGDTNPYRSIQRFWNIVERRFALAPMFGVNHLIHDAEFSQDRRSPVEFPLDPVNRVQRFALSSDVAVRSLVLRGSTESGARLEAAAATQNGGILPIEIGIGESAFRGSLQFELPTTLDTLWVRLAEGTRAVVESISINGSEVSLPPEFERIAPGLYRLTDALPRAHLTPLSRELPTEPRIAQALRGDADLQENVLLLASDGESKDSASWTARQWAAAQTRIAEYRFRRVAVETEAPTGAWLVLSDFYHRNWRADIDGEPASIRRANLFARAVWVPAGEHTVVFSFADPLVGVGSWLSLGAAIACIVLIILAIRRPSAEATA